MAARHTAAGNNARQFNEKAIVCGRGRLDKVEFFIALSLLILCSVRMILDLAYAASGLLCPVVNPCSNFLCLTAF
ncbi:MAG: hypothetical protein EBR09_14200 [Proteobacteria bacterium]|nr:hypothetical protein [Pseudomonadota bacterium]